ncbi:MAG: DNA modification methylase [Phycisphaerales bacterium]|nr:DNA modification methylase [Phycisphaerales bacterium]
MAVTPECTHIAEPLRYLAVPIGSLVPDASNARRHDEKNVAAIKASLSRWGQRLPLVVQKQGMVVRAGNGRLLAARELGWTHVAALVVEESEVEAVGYAIADNRTGELATWDDEALAKLLESLPGDLAEVAGFSDEDLADLIDGLAPEAVEEDDAPEPRKTAATRPGDLWLLGEHRLLCGDSTKIDDVRRVMNGKKAALVATDPPYLVDYTGERVGDSGKDWSATYREIDIKDADGFFRSVFKNALEVIAPHAAIYCWHAHKRQATISRIWEELGILDHQQVIWLKPTTVFGSVFYHFRHEPCMMGWKQGSKPPHDGDHSVNSVWEVDWGGKARVVGNEHPTQKPVELFARPMRKHTKGGAVCFEPFSGSGSQIIAAEQLKRRCYAIELEPVFVEVAIRRWQELTGQEATLDGDCGGGRTFAEVEAERLSASENAPA